MAAAQPVLSAPALVVAIALLFSLFLALAMQFGSGLYDQHPEIAYFHACLNALLAAVLAALMLLRPNLRPAHATVLIVSVVVIINAFWSIAVKSQFRQGKVDGNGFYVLPHYPFRYETPAQTVWIRTADQVQLACTLMEHKRSRGVVIYPAWRTNRNAFAIATLAQWLANGIDVLVVDPRGQGESEGAKSPDVQEKQDILAAVSYLRSTGHQKVGVVAEEDGAIAAVQATNLHTGIDSLALVAPAETWGESLGQNGHLWDPRGFIGRIYWRVAAGLRLTAGQDLAPLTEAIHYAAPTPVLLTGTKPAVGLTIDRLYAGAGDPKSLIVLGGDGKPVSWSHFAEYYKSLEDWFELTLRVTP